MNALETVKQMSPGEVWDRIASARIRNYGVYPSVLSEYWRTVQEKAKKERTPLKVVAGLNNSDTAGIFLELLKTDASKVMRGINIAAYALDAAEMILHIPEYAADLADGLIETAKAYNIEIVRGLIDRRSGKDGVLHHIAAMADLADLFMGIYQDGIYVSVDGGALKKIPGNVKVAELFTGTGKMIKGVELGCHFYGRDALNVTVEEAAISNGVVHGLSEKDCVIKLTYDRLVSCQSLACGKCVFCREGLIQLQETQKDIIEGRGKQEHLDIIDEIGKAMRGGSLCSMGQEASALALSSLKNFRDEYVKHIRKKDCSAGVCFSSKIVYINPDTCTGCEKCISVCPKDAILGKKGYIHMIDPIDCTGCGACADVCEEGSIVVTEGKPPKLPERLTKCGRFRN